MFQHEWASSTGVTLQSGLTENRRETTLPLCFAECLRVLDAQTPLKGRQRIDFCTTSRGFDLHTKQIFVWPTESGSESLCMWITFANRIYSGPTVFIKRKIKE